MAITSASESHMGERTSFKKQKQTKNKQKNKQTNKQKLTGPFVIHT